MEGWHSPRHSPVGPDTLMSAPSPIHRGLSLGASGQESPPHTEPSRPHRLASPLRTHSDTGPLPPLSGLPGLRDSPRTTRCHGQRLGCPRHPQDPLEGGTVPCEAPPRGVVPSLRGGLPPPPATVAGVATVRQGPICSRQVAPRAPCLTLVGSGFPMRHRLVGLPLSPRWACPFAPGQAPPGREFVHGPRKGGCPARPPRGGPSPAARRRLPTFTWSPVLSGLPGHAPGTPRPRI